MDANLPTGWQAQTSSPSSAIPLPPHGGSAKQSTSRNYATPMSVVRGTILCSFQGLQLYDVAIDNARIRASYAGISSAGMGTKEATVLLPGTQVWVALDLRAPRNTPVILGAAAVAVSGYYTDGSPQWGTYPQTAGYEIQPVEGSAPGKDQKFTGMRLSGKAFLNQKRLTNYNSGVLDTTEGDWVKHNNLGGGVAVEPFRVWMRGSPAAGVMFFSDEDQTRIYGSTVEIISMAETYQDAMVGRVLEKRLQRHNYPSDVLFGNPAQELGFNGPHYRGDQWYSTYRAKDNLSIIGGTGDPVTDPGQTALLHEYRGYDGTYVLTAASSITLQKFVGVLLPTPKVANEVTKAKTPEYPGVISIADDTRTDAIPEIEGFPKPFTDVKEPQVTSDEKIVEALTNEYVQYVEDSVTKAVAIALNINPAILATINSQSQLLFRKDTDNWTLKKYPGFLKPKESKGKLQSPTFPRVGYGMWKNVPANFVMNLTSYGGSKRYYLGRAAVTITDDGGIVLSDAYGSTITMSGGNIVLSAEHDVIVNTGRNTQITSGRDTSITAGRHLEMLANEGRASLIANADLSLVGGMDGLHGIVIDSRGKHQTDLSTGKPDKQSVTVGGLVMKTEGLLTLSSNGMRLNSQDGDINCKAAHTFTMWLGEKQTYSFGSSGLLIAEDTEPGIPQMETALWLCTRGSFMNHLRVTGNLTTYGRAQAKQKNIADYFMNFNPVTTLNKDFKNNMFKDGQGVLVDNNDTDVFAKFLTSKNYNATDTLYENMYPEWAVRYEEATKAEGDVGADDPNAEGDSDTTGGAGNNDDSKEAPDFTLQTKALLKVFYIKDTMPVPGKERWEEEHIKMRTPYSGAAAWQTVGGATYATKDKKGTEWPRAI